jgi:uncharacterized protein YydD (DUF2326 family)
MKLSKIYSNRQFHNTKFNVGLSVIYANVKAKDKSGPNSSHNLGKSKLIDLIDFLLLKGITPKKHFLTSTKDSVTNQLKFDGYEFYLEILLNSGSFLTIKRNVSESSKVSMRLSEESVEEFQIPTSWDFINITIDDAKEKLNSYLEFDYFKLNTDFDYRDLINFSLRAQGDYADLFKLSKFTFDEKKWKTFMFSLLGFDGSAPARKYAVEDEIKNKNKVIREQEEGFNIQSNQKDEIEGFIQLLNNSKREKNQELDSLNFFNEDDRLISELVDDIETRIGELNKVSYNLQFEIKKINDSLKFNIGFDIDVVKEIFNEVEIYFPDQLTKSYEDLVKFNIEITLERNGLLKESLSRKIEALRSTKLMLADLHAEKEKFKDLIQDNSIIKKLKEYQSELIKIENNVARHQAQLDSIKVIESKKTEIDKLDDELKSAAQNLLTILENTSSNIRYNNIRNFFSSFADIILKYPAIISVAPNNNKNIEYSYRIGETRKSDGNTYTKMLCIAFDMAILAEYSYESYFKFVYHDDVFSNQENKIRVRLFNLLKEYCVKYNIQYILSVIKDDLPRDDFENYINFDDDEIVMNLHDKNDQGKLFKMSF